SAADRDALAEQTHRRGRAERDDHAWLQQLELGEEPGLADLHLAAIGALMESLLADLLELEVLDRVGQPDVLAREPDRRERAVEHATGGTDERMTGEVFAIAGLLADEHDARVV